MSKRSPYTAKKKYQIIKEYEDGFGTVSSICYRYKIAKSTFEYWRYKYGKNGIEGLKESKVWKKYSKELKEIAVEDYLTRGYSLADVIRKYEISSKSVLQKWVDKYNSHRELKATAEGMSHSMTKGRPTTWKEKIEIVLYCIANNNDYQKTADVYHVSYQQVYQWANKYDSGGEDALKDRRGRKKDEGELTSEEKTKLR